MPGPAFNDSEAECQALVRVKGLGAPFQKYPQRDEAANVSISCFIVVQTMMLLSEVISASLSLTEGKSCCC